MKTLARSLALAAGLASAAALVPGAAFAANGHAFAGSGWHGGNGARGGSVHDGHWGRRGPGVVWGGVGLGLGIGAVGYYGGWWGPYGYAPSPYNYYDGYYFYNQAPTVIVDPAPSPLADPASRAGQPVPQASRAPDPIFYPNKGQNAATVESDRRECNRWATTQNGAMADASIFQRATFACMEGRGYTVK